MFFSELDNQHHIIELEFTRQIFKTQKEAEGLQVNKAQLKYSVLYLPVDREHLITGKKHVLDYLKLGEDPKNDIPNIQSVSGRPRWYDLSASAYAGDFIFPSKIGETFRLVDNRQSHALCDKVNYVVALSKDAEEFGDEMFLILNSIFFRYSIDLYSRQLTGAQTLSDVDVNVVAKTRIPKPENFRKFLPRASEIALKLRQRDQGNIFEETKHSERREIDMAVLEALGADPMLVDDLYPAACKYVQDRQIKSESLRTTKVKQRLSYDDALKLIRERFPEVRSYKKLIKGMSTTNIVVPDGKGEYPKVVLPNLFGAYQIYFKGSKQTQPVEFSTPEQMQLFEFLNRTLLISGQSIRLPENQKDCSAVLDNLRQDFDDYSGQIRSVLRLNRSSVNYLSVYRDVVLNR